jgi:hypothetical protein
VNDDQGPLALAPESAQPVAGAGDRGEGAVVTGRRRRSAAPGVVAAGRDVKGERFGLGARPGQAEDGGSEE